jgi:signal transduction histidine kinase
MSTGKTPFVRGVAYVREHPQLLMTIALAVVIPIAFLVSGQQFLSAARENQERLEKDRVGIVHDLIAALMVATSFDTDRVQSELVRLGEQNPDITKLRIGREEGSDVLIVASIEPTLIGTFAEEPNTYRLGNTNPNESLIMPYADSGIRYWQSFRLVRTEGFPDHYIFIETSLEHIDIQLAGRIIYAYYWLIGLLLIILYMLFRHVRLIDYSYLYRETKKANEMKDLFTNMIAHELRAPLTAMRGYASMIRERSDIDAETKRNATEIESAAGRLVTIVSDLLDIARIQSGKLHIEAGTVHVSGVSRSVVEALHPSADEKHITLRVSDTNGTIVLPGDEKRFYQVLTNVVSNAIKYTKEGEIAIELTDVTDRVEIRVKDTGMGISSENQKKMFAPFFRVEGEETAAITGTGLGMWVTKQLVELMGGSIGIESIKGVGTHVVLTFPKQSGTKS